MAKRKKKSTKNSKSKKSTSKSQSSRSKAPKQDDGVPPKFWRQAAAVGLFLLALLLLFGSFAAGGPLAEQLFEWARWMIGVVAFISPVLLIFASVQKFRGEDIKIPRKTFVGLMIFLISASGLFHLFVDGDSVTAANDGMGGGMLGHIIASGILSVLNTLTGSLLLIVTGIIAIHFMLRIPLNSSLRFFGMSNSDADKPAKPEKAQQEDKPGFKLNEGVPVQKSPRRMNSFKNSAKKIDVDDASALTATADPSWKLPDLDLLEKKQDTADAGDVEANAKNIQETLSDFNINVEMQGANIGPRVTQYTLKPPSGVRLTKITALENNLALNLAATSIRIEAPIPGKRAVGIEVPNYKAATVRMRSILESQDWKTLNSPLGFSIGKDIAGHPVVAALDKMPHLLIAGATGSGKSIMINTFLTSLLYRNSPAEMKLILVDPKQVELTPYNDIPHLLTPVITQPEKCLSALKWAVAEMERRYTLLAEAKKRNIEDYNKIKKDEAMPYIVIVIDELADLMMLAARDVETLIVRLAQKARAIGIHLVLATQRPSVDVITGLIKANVPARIAFTVTSQVDSRTIIDQTGAEKLLGQGDMLMSTPQLAKPRRIQGAFIDEPEVMAVTDFIREQRAPEYDDDIVSQQVQIGGSNSIGGGLVGGDDADDALYQDAVRVVVESGKASASLLQRRLRVGYARAARLVESMEEQGIIGPADGARPREVLISSLDDILDDEPEPGA